MLYRDFENVRMYMSLTRLLIHLCLCSRGANGGISVFLRGNDISCACVAVAPARPLLSLRLTWSWTLLPPSTILWILSIWFRGGAFESNIMKRYCSADGKQRQWPTMHFPHQIWASRTAASCSTLSTCPEVADASQISLFAPSMIQYPAIRPRLRFARAIFILPRGM